MNNKILSTVLILWITATWFAAFSNANEEWNILNWVNRTFNNMDFKWEWNLKKGSKFDWNIEAGRKFMNKLSTEEKASLENMSDEEKKEFLETKREENKTNMEAREVVIDALLAWETLTAEQETLRSEIIKLRAERKIQKEEMQAKKEEFREIMEKKKNWEELSEEEKAKIDELKQNKGFWKKWKKWGFNSRWIHR